MAVYYTTEYTTAVDVKAYAKITYSDLGLADDTAYTTFIDPLIAIVEKIIDDHCGVPSTFFKASGLTITDEYHDGDGGDELWVKYRPIVSVTTLSRNKAGLTAEADWEELTAGPGADTHYLLYAEKGYVYIYGRRPGVGHKNIKITYVGGYATVPGPVAHVCKELVSNILRGVLKRKLDPQNVTAVLMEGGDVRALFAEDVALSKEHKRLLVAYRLSRVGVG